MPFFITGNGLDWSATDAEARRAETSSINKSPETVKNLAVLDAHNTLFLIDFRSKKYADRLPPHDGGEYISALGFVNGH